MKRWILGLLFVTLLLLVGAFFLGMTMQERITQRNFPAATQVVDLLNVGKGTPAEPAAWQEANESALIAVPVSISEPTPPVGLGLPPILPNSKPEPRSEPSYIAEGYVDDSSAAVPGNSWSPVPPNNNAPPSMVAQQRVRFGHSIPAAARNQKPSVVDLADSMSYLIDVSHKDKSQIRKVQSPRIHGGKQVIVSDVQFVFGNQHLPDFRVFAEDVDVTSVDDQFELTCKGKVVVVANQSMLRGEGLELKDGVFKVAKAEVVTADAVIKAGDSEFEFAVGGISVNRLAKHEEEVAENREESLPAFLRPPSLPSLPAVE